MAVALEALPFSEVVVLAKRVEHTRVVVRRDLSAPNGYLPFIAVQNLRNAPVTFVRVSNTDSDVGADVVLLYALSGVMVD